MSQRAKRLNRLENDGGGGGGGSSIGASVGIGGGGGGAGSSSNGGINGPPPIKRRKGRPPLNPHAHIITTSIAEDDDSINLHANSSSASWQPRPIMDLKMNSIYNRNAPEAPAELFRFDV